MSDLTRAITDAIAQVRLDSGGIGQDVATATGLHRIGSCPAVAEVRELDDDAFAEYGQASLHEHRSGAPLQALCGCLGPRVREALAWIGCASELTTASTAPLAGRYDAYTERRDLDPFWLDVDPRAHRPCCSPQVPRDSPPAGPYLPLLNAYRTLVHARLVMPNPEAPLLVVDHEAIHDAWPEDELSWAVAELAGHHPLVADPVESDLAVFTLTPERATAVAAALGGQVLPAGAIDDASWPLLTRLVADQRQNPIGRFASIFRPATLRDQLLPEHADLQTLAKSAWDATH